MTNGSMETSGRKSSVWRWALGIVGGILLVAVAAGGYVAWRMSTAPAASLDYSTTRASERGLYRISYTPSPAPPPINRLHTWALTVQTADGQPVEGARIAVEGEMPQHGHGLATQPRVTAYRGDGNYLVEGLKFQMGGWWVVHFTVSANGETDSVRFNLQLR